MDAIERVEESGYVQARDVAILLGARISELEARLKLQQVFIAATLGVALLALLWGCLRPAPRWRISSAAPAAVATTTSGGSYVLVAPRAQGGIAGSSVIIRQGQIGER